jgi:hypothetical protein
MQGIPPDRTQLKYSFALRFRPLTSWLGVVRLQIKGSRMSNHCSIGHDLDYELAKHHFNFEKKEDLPPELFDGKTYHDCLAKLDEHFWKCPQCAVAEYSYLDAEALRRYLN